MKNAVNKFSTKSPAIFIVGLSFISGMLLSFNVVQKNAFLLGLQAVSFTPLESVIPLYRHDTADEQNETTHQHNNTIPLPWYLDGAHPLKYVAPETLFRVPFYVYTDLLMLDNATYNDMPIEETITGDFKHDDDHHFILSSLKHPMRTMDPSEAKVFVVPIHFNWLIISVTYHFKGGNGFCWNGLCRQEIFNYINDYLGQSEWFQQSSGSDHVAPLSFFAHAHNIRNYTNILSCNAMIWRDAPLPIIDDRLLMSSMYVGKACELESTKEYDTVMVASMPTNKRNFNIRSKICNWLQNQKDDETGDTSYNITYPVCGEGIQCPALAQSKYGFHVRGDTPTSNRLFDTLLSGTVPIFTMKEQYEMAPEFVAWENLTEFIPAQDMDDKATFLSKLQAIINDTETYEQKHKAIIENRQLFNWTSGVPFDIYMYQLQKHLWPELRANSSRYSALIL